MVLKAMQDVVFGMGIAKLATLFILPTECSGHRSRVLLTLILFTLEEIVCR